MSMLSKAEIEKALLGAQGKRPAPAQGSVARASSARKSRKAPLWGGLGEDRLKALDEDLQRRLEQLIQQRKAGALDVAAQSKALLVSNIAAKTEALLAAATVTAIRLEPILIMGLPPIPGVQGVLNSTGGGGQAKFKFSSTSTGTQKVGFYYLWPSPYSDLAIIDAIAFFGCSGFIHAHSKWRPWPTEAAMAASAVLNVWRGWPDDVTSGNSDSEPIGSVLALAGVFTSDTEATAIQIYQLDLEADLFVAAPGELVVFEEVIELDYYVDAGSIWADFESGEFAVYAGDMVVLVLNNPPS